MKSRNSTRRGFTLLELLVVMTIIAVLAGGIFAAAQFAIRKARTVQAQNMAVGLASAISNFRQDYTRWPVTAEKSESTNELLIHLLGRDTSKNKRGRNYADNLPVGKNTSGGLIYSGDTAELRDPWGELFTVHIDINNDGEISNPEGAGSGSSGTLRLKVAVVSKGNDKMMSGINDDGQDATRDNARSW